MTEEVRRIKDAPGDLGRIREAIYDLAVAGEEFTLYDVVGKVGLDRKVDGTQEKVSSALRTGVKLGFLEVADEKRRMYVPVTDEEYKAGASPVKRAVIVYRGGAKVRKGGSNAEG